MKTDVALLFFVIFALFAGCAQYSRFSAEYTSAKLSRYDNLDYGIPCKSDQIVDREGYALGWSSKLKQPLWVQYRLTKEEVMSNVVKRTNEFVDDNTITNGQSSSRDYWRSGYDRGHLAPAADMHWSTNAMKESFLISNMSPQTPLLNRNIWASIEAFARDQAVEEGSVVIVTGPIATNTSPNTIGVNDVVVPDAFYKVVYDETPPCKMIAFIVQNKTNDLPNVISEYIVDAVDVESIAGLQLFSLVCTNDTMNAMKKSSDISKWRGQRR